MDSFKVAHDCTIPCVLKYRTGNAELTLKVREFLGTPPEETTLVVNISLAANSSPMRYGFIVTLRPDLETVVRRKQK